MTLKIDIRKKLASFNLEVALELEAETLGFLGVSGCGKSMTLRCIAGVETPDEGIIQVNGQTYFDSAAHINLSPQRRKTALLFQNFQLFPHLSVQANIAAGIGHDLDAPRRKDLIAQQIRRFSLEGMEKRYPFRLSGGQQQRVALARMLAAQPGILMLDEPFTALDAHLKSDLEQDLLGLFDSFDGSILFVSHDIDEAFRFCDRIAVVDEGHIEEIGSKERIVQNPQSLAGLKLSGCKNTTPALYVDEHKAHLPELGIDLVSAASVPHELAYLGVPAFSMRHVHSSKACADKNIFRVRADCVSDSRFERTAMVSFLDAKDSRLTLANEDATDSANFAHSHFQWQQTAYDKNTHIQFPEQGDEFFLEIPPDHIYLVTH